MFRGSLGLVTLDNRVDASGVGTGVVGTGVGTGVGGTLTLVFIAQWSAVALLAWLFREQRARDRARRARTRTLRLPQ